MESLFYRQIVDCKILIIHNPQGFSGIIYNTGGGSFCKTAYVALMLPPNLPPPIPRVSVKFETTTPGATSPTLY